MKIEQRKEYVPIVITLETEADASAFISIIDDVKKSAAPYKYQFAVKVSNWFSNHARL